jgi:hypothetical protein
MICANVGCVLSYCFLTVLFVENRSVHTILEHSQQIVHLGGAYLAEYGRYSAPDMLAAFIIIKEHGGIEFCRCSGEAVTLKAPETTGFRSKLRGELSGRLHAT